ncbi:polysaccharide biosynthesis/export family protein [Pollutimonas sp. H1-120]|uniref:polysaccharide biosynthesis/export family protein n=1 Tax=Pollutimonas sp. H1-120 TaxID=3148824 RepID=UPI003B52D6A4
MTTSTPVHVSTVFSRLRPTIAILTISCLLTACAMAPGMRMGAKTQYGDATEDAAPAGTLIPITPALIAQQSKTASKGGIDKDIKQLFGTRKVYRIGRSDVVNIVVWGHPELGLTPATSNRSMGSTSQADVGNGYNVNPDGTIQFPFIGPIKIAGLTENEARELLTRRLSKYVHDPQVTVRVQAYRNGRIYVDGEVRVPGLQTLDDIPMTLPEAINRAGGFSEEADRSSIALTRNDKTININLSRLTRQGVNPNRILLANGDLLRVRNQVESQVFIMGEVWTPRAQPLHDGRLSLTEALGESGGPNPWTADASQIYVVRKMPVELGGEDALPEIYHLDASSPASFVLANDFQLQPRDVVYVDPAPVVRWNRFITNLLPSYNSLFINTRNTTR